MRANEDAVLGWRSLVARDPIELEYRRYLAVQQRIAGKYTPVSFRSQNAIRPRSRVLYGPAARNQQCSLLIHFVPNQTQNWSRSVSRYDRASAVMRLTPLLR